MDGSLQENSGSESAAGEDGGVHGPRQEEPPQQGGRSLVEPESRVDLAAKAAHHR